MKYIPYGRQAISETDINAVIKVLRSPFLTQGPSIEKFEKQIANFCGTKYAVASSSGTAALHSACFAADILQYDEVITSPLTFAASANCVLYCGGRPIFVDVRKDNSVIDPGSIEKEITSKTKAIIAIDYSGMPADYDEINRIARKYNLIVISDAAHSLGSLYKGRKVGTLADMTVLSFHPVKIITTGEGGMVLTNDKNFYQRLLQFRTHGITKDKQLLTNKTEGPWFYEMHELGFNYRLTDIHAVLGISQFKRINSFIRARRRIAKKYLKDLHGLPFITLPSVPSDRESSWHLFPIRVSFLRLKKTRKEMFDFFAKNKIKLQVHYIPVHMHPYYQKKFGYKRGDYINAETFYDEEVSLPIFSALTEDDQIHVINTLLAFLKA